MNAGIAGATRRRWHPDALAVLTTVLICVVTWMAKGRRGSLASHQWTVTWSRSGPDDIVDALLCGCVGSSSTTRSEARHALDCIRYGCFTGSSLEAAMTAAETTSFVLPDAGVYIIDPGRSTLHYTGRHMFGLGTVRARFAITSGEVRLAADVGSSSAVAWVDAGSFSSNSTRRDKDVRSAALLDVDTYPEIRFRSTALHEHGDLWRLEGDVTAHGKTVPVPVDIHSVARDGNEIRVIARAERLDRLRFGISKSRGMVGRFLDLDLDIVAVTTGTPV